MPPTFLTGDNMIYWAPLLHFYQPPTQVYRVLQKVCDESYRPLVNLFHELSHAKVTVNISGVLTEMLDEHGMSDVIEGLRGLAEKGQVEFTGSGKYHPILPLIPQDEMRRQIVQNYQTNRRFFGENYSPRGFFPPEMGYSRDTIKSILDTGHTWFIVSGVACPTAWPTDLIHEVSDDGRRLAVFFRDDVLSNRISFKQTDAGGFISQLRSLSPKTGDVYVITAMDAETFGHHIKHWEELFLAEVYEALEAGASLVESASLAQEHGALLRAPVVAEPGEIQVVTISELLDLFPRGQCIEPRPSSWSTRLEDISGSPYPLWKAKDNPIHELQWQHLEIVIDLVRKALEVATTEPAKSHAEIARGFLDRALHSDQFWWVSRKPMWDVNLINRGLMQQQQAVLNAYKAITMGKISEEGKKEYYRRVIASRDLRDKITDQLFMY